LGQPRVAATGTLRRHNENIKFDNTTGYVLEGEYLFNPKMSAKLRHVSEKFKPEGSGSEADGDHLGLMFNYYF
jgi:hypothetical protein